MIRKWEIRISHGITKVRRVEDWQLNLMIRSQTLIAASHWLTRRPPSTTGCVRLPFPSPLLIFISTSLPANMSISLCWGKRPWDSHSSQLGNWTQRCHCWTPFCRKRPNCNSISPQKSNRHGGMYMTFSYSPTTVSGDFCRIWPVSLVRICVRSCRHGCGTLFSWVRVT